MKNSFEWKKDINNKVVEKRERIAKRNAQMRTISGMSLALLVCLGCSVAVVRFSKINQPPVDTINNGIMTIPNFTDYTFPSVTVQNTTDGKGVMTITVPPETEPPQTDDSGVMTIPSFPTFTAAPDTEDGSGKATGDTGDYPTSHPVYTGVDPYPVTTGGDAFETTSTNSNRLQVDEIINRAFPEKLQFPDATEYTKTFAMALEYYGLSDLNIAPSLRGGAVYRIDFSDNYTFLVDDNSGSFGIVVRDDITVNYVSDDNDAYYQLSMGCVSLPYDWMFTTAENNTFEYRGVEVKTGYINGNGIGAELIVADYEYNGIKFRFSGYNVTEKEYLSCLYTVIDCLFRK